MVKALTCPNCSAPLPTPTGGAFLVCGYCGTTAQIEQSDAGQRKPAPEPPSPYPSSEERADFGSSFNACLLDRKPFVVALEEAARSSLSAYGDPRAMVYTVAHLVTDFERETGAEVRADPLVIVRVMQAYYPAVDEVARTGKSEINLPFLSATERGPVHLRRSLGQDELARMGSAPPSVAPDPRPAPAPEPKKKKKGWLW